ncbi:MAG TPA: TIGR03905 family TSCPD domain-containing protein [Clostridiaceae bacterium]
MYKYKTSGVCSKEINYDIIDNKIFNVSFKNGCKGNLLALSSLLQGMEVEVALNKLKGIKCQGNTSCPDQFARALEEYLAKKA